MKAYKLNFGKIILVQMGLAVLLNTMLSTAAWGKAIVNIKVKGETVGFVDVDTDTLFGSEGLAGGFEVIKKNSDGSTMTIEQLQNEIRSQTGFDKFHFNWLQIITRDTAPRRPNNVNGNPLFAPYYRFT